ncbi:recombinase family protein [Brevibacillus composti]|uniref:Recombinase family protein n=1 Tax=Brevibacillus composti TaxID=2796470 RepID=A0A7T5EMX2_9BACL|nr:recombinase family protein [Brevibacillus composti]QQE75544.1 recombinase family protein [Brevibacillus composti]QUO42570.1 recombinase family protein [Brevibacillus composti]
MRTAIYLRVSTEEQAAEGFSIAAQKERLLAYIQSQGWALAGVYTDEGVSAKDIHRAELRRLLADVRAGKIDIVLVYRLDRLTRSVLDLYQLLQVFEESNVRFKSCTEVYDTTTAIGRLFITLVAALAQWERENLGERVKLGMEQMARERKRPGGPPPYGYTLKQGQLVPHPEEATVVQRMYQQYVAGSTPGQIAERANREGYRGKHGGKWSGSAVSRLLRNPVYCGTLRWNYAEAGQRQNKPDEWILIEGSHPAIIDRETFRRAEERLLHRQQKHPRALASPFLFSGLLYCARCQGEMRGKTAVIRKNSGKRYRHVYYLCKNRKEGACQAPALREDRLEAELLDRLSSFQEELWSAMRHTLQRKRPASPVHRAAGSPEQLAQKRRRWMQAYEAGVISLEELQARQRELAREEMERSDEECSPAALMEKIAMEAKGEKRKLDWAWIWEQATREERKQLIQLLLQRLEAEAGPPAAPHQGRPALLRLVEYR